eukprot:scaffold162436_cov35-Tisochrysis_lutea.AAC.2
MEEHTHVLKTKVRTAHGNNPHASCIQNKQQRQYGWSTPGHHALFIYSRNLEFHSVLQQFNDTMHPNKTCPKVAL